jgi:hypothetical protein
MPAIGEHRTLRCVEMILDQSALKLRMLAVDSEINLATVAVAHYQRQAA